MNDEEIIKIIDTIIKYIKREDKKFFSFHVGSRIFYSIVNFFNKQSASLPLVTPAINPIHYKGYTVFEERTLPESCIQLELEITERRRVTVSKVADDGEILYSMLPQDVLPKDTIYFIDKEIKKW